jgi:hypothetical protein
MGKLDKAVVKEVKLIKCVVLVANRDWNKGDIVEVPEGDPRIGKEVAVK